MKDEAEEEEDKNDAEDDEEEDEKIDQINDGNKNSLLVDLSAGGKFPLVIHVNFNLAFKEVVVRCRMMSLHNQHQIRDSETSFLKIAWLFQKFV